ncbi:MAG: double-strand break repair protein AddB, partial [Pseudomonadota bacterium]|nr:double-strand break repair protein AddB [Pseudomonadota bacterium]
ILGGLNEGVWPPQTQNDPWLSRPMRSGVGLSPPERRVGLAAQDFCGAFASKEVLLVRASRVGGAPTVASRWLQRLTALVGEERTRTLRRRGEHYLDWARRIDQPLAVSPCARPDPKPPIAARPRRLSITEIEHWVRDPYTIYARHVLRLEPLDPLDAEPGGAERGTLIHEALNRFARKTCEAWPEDAASLLLAEGRALFEAYRDYPAFTAYWWPRFERIAAWFCGFEPARRDGCAALHVEIQGEIAFDAPAGPFTLRGRADRIDLRADGTLAILDYKTGRPASPKEVRAGLAPQLALEAAMARRGAFDPAFKDRSVGELAFVRLSGGEPAGEHKPCTWDRQGVTIDDVAEEAWQRLTELVARFDDPEQGYLAMPHPQFRLAYGAYDHLARVREWSETGGVELDR